MHFHEKPKKDNGKLQMEQLIEVIKAAADPPVIGTLQACRLFLLVWHVAFELF